MFAKANSSTPNTFNSEDLSIHVLKKVSMGFVKYSSEQLNEGREMKDV